VFSRTFERSFLQLFLFPIIHSARAVTFSFRPPDSIFFCLPISLPTATVTDSNTMAFCLLIFVILCVKCTTTSTLEARLAGDNRPPNAGRLEIYYNNIWGTVSYAGFDNREARVACYMLGFGRSGLSISRYYGGGSGPVWLDRLYCRGNESSLAECRHAGWGVRSRGHNYDVSIICDDNNNCSTSHSGCEIVWNTDMHTLHYELLYIRGTLSLHKLQSFCGAWKNCSINLQRVSCTFYDLYVKVLQYPEWRRFKVNVVMQRRYNNVVSSIHHMCNNIEPHYEEYRPCYRNLYNTLRDECYYGRGGRCEWLESRQYCYARKILENCNTSVADINMLNMVIYGAGLRFFQYYDDWSCSITVDQVIGNFTDLGEFMNSMPRIKARLAGDNRLPNAGRLEIYYNNTWGTVSDHSFYDRHARVACYMLGFGRSGLSIHSYYGVGSGPVWLHGVSCTGSELSLAECGHSGWGVSIYGHSYDVSIICDDNNCSTSHPGCDVVWNTDVRSLYFKLLRGTLSRYQLQSFCVAWNNCSKNVEREGCTFNDLAIKVLQNFNGYLRYCSRYNVTQHRYNEVIEAMHFLCGSVERDYEIYIICFQSRLYNSLREGCRYDKRFRSCSWLQSVKYCYARKIQQTCNTSAAIIGMFKAILYGKAVLSHLRPNLST